ncbi:hypothetical protein [Planotetraspora phitsanulokensis]|nr:hypothetical protein [Planotetraspora phitsanulokensis]
MMTDATDDGLPGTADERHRPPPTFGRGLVVLTEEGGPRPGL